MPPQARRLKIEIPTLQAGETMTTKSEPTETPAEARPGTVTLTNEQFDRLLAAGHAAQAAPVERVSERDTGYEGDDHLCGAPRKVKGELIGGCNMPVTHVGEGRASVEHTIYATDENGDVVGIGEGHDRRARVIAQWNALFRGEGRVRPGLAEGVNDGPELCEYGCFPFGWQLGQASQSCQHGTFTR